MKAADNGDFAIHQAGTGDRLYVTQGGNVGIGTTTPDHRLVVGGASGGRWLVVNDIPDARWGLATGGYDLAIQNDNDGTPDGSGGGTWTTRLFLTEDGNVGIGTLTPTAKLDVNGAIKGGGVLAGAWQSAPTAGVSISSQTPTEVAGSAVTFSVDRPVTVIASYSINVQPNGAPGSDFVVTTLQIDGTFHNQAASHFQPFCAGDCNVNLSGTAVVTLGAGTHTARLFWRCWSCSIGWSNDPGWCGTGGNACGGRTVTVLAFYQ